MAIQWILLVILGVLVLYVILLFNSLIMLKNRVENAFSQIDVQLKRRYDLIPNLIESVKGYMKHEKSTLTEITKMRSSLMSGDIHKKAKASDQLTNAFKSLFAVAENYPQLKASENFQMLQEELSGTENKISYARQFYNDQVEKFNIKIQKFPALFIARMLNFTKKEFFDTPEEERKNIKVKF